MDCTDVGYSRSYRFLIIDYRFMVRGRGEEKNKIPLFVALARVEKKIKMEEGGGRRKEKEKGEEVDKDSVEVL